MNKLQRSQDPHGWADTVEARLRMLAVAVLVLAGVTACATVEKEPDEGEAEYCNNPDVTKCTDEELAAEFGD